MIDLLMVLEGPRDRAVMQALLNRVHGLGIRPVTFEFDLRFNTVRTQGPNIARERRRRFHYVIRLWDHRPGCFTQGASFEESCENLIDAIEVWIMAGLQSGEELPVVNGCQLAITATQRGRQRAKAQLSIQTRVGA